jgi:hypothetical protein
MNEHEHDYAAEAQRILAGTTLILATTQHLQALNEAWQEKYDCALIQVANRLEMLKKEVMAK